VEKRVREVKKVVAVLGKGGLEKVRLRTRGFLESHDEVRTTKIKKPLPTRSGRLKTQGSVGYEVFKASNTCHKGKIRRTSRTGGTWLWTTSGEKKGGPRFRKLRDIGRGRLGIPVREYRPVERKNIRRERPKNSGPHRCRLESKKRRADGVLRPKEEPGLSRVMGREVIS